MLCRGVSMRGIVVEEYYKLEKDVQRDDYYDYVKVLELLDKDNDVLPGELLVKCECFHKEDWLNTHIFYFEPKSLIVNTGVQDEDTGYKNWRKL